MEDILVHFWWWLEHFFGIDNLSGQAYGFWSGIGSDIGEIAIVGGVVQLYRKHNCHVNGCWRIGRHSVEGTPYIVCKKHHPGIPRGEITAAQVHQAHYKFLKDKEQ